MQTLKSIALRSYFFGIEHLLAIRSDSLRFYRRLHTLNQDAIRIRLGPYRCWFLFHPSLIEQALAKHADDFIRFEKIMNTLRQWNGDSLLIAEGNSWKERRRKVLPAFKQQRIPEYSNIVGQQSRGLLFKWQEEIFKNGIYTCDIDKEMAAHSLDIAVLTLFGKSLALNAHKISETVHDLSELAFRETTSPLKLPDWLPLPFNFQKKKTIQTIRHYIRKIVTERLSSEHRDRGDLLSVLIDHHGRDQQAIEDDSMSLLIAGHETTGSTLAWLFILLAQHSNVLNTIQKELDEVSGGANIDYNMLPRLIHLTAAVNESMRLYPSAYALFCRRAVNEVDLGGGFIIKAGDLVQIMPYITQRDGRWFDQAESFRPERFLGDTNFPRYAYIPFGAGPRMCIGQSFALMEVLMTAATIIQKIEPSDPAEKNLVPSPRFSLRPKSGFNLTWRVRGGYDAG